MTHTQKAIFIGGPLDGQTKAMRAAPYYTVIEFSARTWEKIEQILSDLLQHIDGHHESFPAGVTAARVLSD